MHILLLPVAVGLIVGLLTSLRQTRGEVRVLRARLELHLQGRLPVCANLASC